MTPEQLEEAKQLYILSKLSPEEVDVSDQVKEVKAIIARQHSILKSLQTLCSHPLIAREHKNDGYSGGWDRDSGYWTAHTCTLCGLRWNTSQRWSLVGDKMGHPSDLKAKEDD